MQAEDKQLQARQSNLTCWASRPALFMFKLRISAWRPMQVEDRQAQARQSHLTSWARLPGSFTSRIGTGRSTQFEDQQVQARQGNLTSQARLPVSFTSRISTWRPMQVEDRQVQPRQSKLTSRAAGLPALFRLRMSTWRHMQVEDKQARRPARFSGLVQVACAPLAPLLVPIESRAGPMQQRGVLHLVSLLLGAAFVRFIFLFRVAVMPAYAEQTSRTDLPASGCL